MFVLSLNVSKMNWCTFIVFIFVIITNIQSKPFFNRLRSTTETNIADLREKLVNVETSQTNDEENQAIPSFIQKKIAKLFRKIQFITSLSNGFTTKRPEIDIDFEDIDNENSPKTTTEDIFTNISNTTEDNLSVIGRKVEKEELDMTSRLQNVKYEFSPIGIGVYFMELVGSLVGLVYGAALQVSSVTQPSV